MWVIWKNLVDLINNAENLLKSSGWVVVSKEIAVILVTQHEDNPRFKHGMKVTVDAKTRDFKIK